MGASLATIAALGGIAAATGSVAGAQPAPPGAAKPASTAEQACLKPLPGLTAGELVGKGSKKICVRSPAPEPGPYLAEPIGNLAALIDNDRHYPEEARRFFEEGPVEGSASDPTGALRIARSRCRAARPRSTRRAATC